MGTDAPKHGAPLFLPSLLGTGSPASGLPDHLHVHDHQQGEGDEGVEEGDPLQSGPGKGTAEGFTEFRCEQGGGGEKWGGRGEDGGVAARLGGAGVPKTGEQSPTSQCR